MLVFLVHGKENSSQLFASEYYKILETYIEKHKRTTVSVILLVYVLFLIFFYIARFTGAFSQKYPFKKILRKFIKNQWKMNFCAFF